MDQEKLKDLIQKSIQGDREAQETLVLAVQNKVYYHCKKMLKKEEAAQDAAQDVLIVMLTSLNKLKEPAAFWGWVNGITANRCRHLLSAPHKEWQIPEDEEGDSLLDGVENLDETLVPEKALDNEETRRMILDLVDALPPEQRMCVLFYYYDEMSVREIAQAMETSEGTVKSRLNYARKSIKAGVEDYERKGVKLYSVSPILLLLYFLRREAESTVLDGTTAATMAGRVLAQARSAASAAAAGGTAAAQTAATGGAATGVSTGSGAAGTAAGAAAAGISVKVVAAILAGAVVIGGAAVGLAFRSGSAEPAASETPEILQSEAPDNTSFGALHGFTLVEPRAYEDVPLTAMVGDPALEVLSSAGGLTKPDIMVSEPDGEGYVTYTIRYTNTAQVRMGNPGSASLAFTILTQEYGLYDWYTGQLYFPDQRAGTGNQDLATGEGQVDYNGETYPITYEKQWTSGINYGDWEESNRSGLEREITVDTYQDVTYTVRVPEGYDGVLLGVNIVDSPDPERAIQSEWDLELDDPAHYEFVRLSDHAAPAEEGGLTPEAAAAYVGVLEEQRDLIETYVSWYDGIRDLSPVALADVWGDGTPELLFVASDPDLPWSQSVLTIVTCQNGQAVTILQEDWDFFAGSGLRYTVFLAEDGTLWADASYSTSHLVEDPRIFTENADGLTMGAAETLPDPAQVLLSNQEEAEAAMTVDEAMAFLQESGGV